ncbi:hypothetical protein L1D34_11150 [Vibrio mediterranei]|uniref:hypothetical protein n=1 Tax=Vibrio mediterranei TaxID=689 RepID=UPI001EFE79C5|nr:hypothetical protein [Vibrio mediterranei]MCG9625401.1 hypothetical protein [Vibrio mediterranei]
MKKTTELNAHQLVVGMVIRCPIDGDTIKITELIAVSDTLFGLGCRKGYTSFDVNGQFELIEPFDLTACNPNWISEQMAELKQQEITYNAWLKDSIESERQTQCKKESK